MHLSTDFNQDRVQITNFGDFEIFLKMHFDQNIYVSCGDGDIDTQLTSTNRSPLINKIKNFVAFWRVPMIAFALVFVYVVLLFVGIYCKERIDLWKRYKALAQFHCQSFMFRNERECYDITF